MRASHCIKHRQAFAITRIIIMIVNASIRRQQIYQCANGVPMGLGCDAALSCTVFEITYCSPHSTVHCVNIAQMASADSDACPGCTPYMPFQSIALSHDLPTTGSIDTLGIVVDLALSKVLSRA